MRQPGRAVIVGASSGIGEHMALWLAGRGWRVGITGRRRDLLDAVAAKSSEHIIVSDFDVDETEKLAGRLDELASRLGGVDLLVISAGCGHINPELAPEPERATAMTNVLAFTAIADWGFARFAEQGGGHLAAITSVGGLIGEGMAPAYPASKAYQILYLDGLRKLARKRGVACRITELRPGPVRTDMMKGEGHFWITSPERAADLACQAIMAGKKLQYISKRWRLIGFALRALSLFS